MKQSNSKIEVTFWNLEKRRLAHGFRSKCQWKWEPKPLFLLNSVPRFSLAHSIYPVTLISTTGGRA